MQDGLALVSAAERLSPDVIVTDISMPGLDGIAATTEILRRNPVARIVLVTVSTAIRRWCSEAWRPARWDTC